MIIFIGGFIGSGRVPLARNLAERLGYHFYEKRIPGLAYLRTIGALKGPGSLVPADSSQLLSFRRLAKELPQLVKMHEGIVITESFHTARSRDFLFDVARKITDTLIIWVDSPDDEALLRDVRTAGGVVNPEDLSFARKKMKDVFEPFDFAPIMFNNTGIAGIAADRFCELIIREMERIR